MSTTTDRRLTAVVALEDLPAAPQLYTGPDAHEPTDDSPEKVRRVDLHEADGVHWYRATERLCRWCLGWYSELNVSGCAYRRAGTVRTGRR